MLSLEQIRKIDAELADKSDIEIEALRADLYATVNLAFDIWWGEKSGSKNPVWSFPAQGEDATL